MNTDIMNNDTKIDMEEFKNSINDIIEDLEVNPERINDLSNEQILELEKHLNPYGATIYGKEKYTCISFTNLKEKYMQKLLTTALIGFTYQMSKEHIVDEDDLTTTLNKDDFNEEVEHPDKSNTDHVNNLTERYYNELKNELLESKKIEETDTPEITEDEELELRTKSNERVNKELVNEIKFNNEKFLKRKEELINEQSESEKKVITRFLNKLFKYDPNVHTQSVHKKNNSDPERQQVVDNEFTENVPPNDTFGRFNYYYDVNYEKLRNAVMYLYNDKPDMEVAINIFDSFDSVEECNEYIEKNKDTVITNLLNLTNYKWNLLGSFKKNRDRMTFYNENTIILENILKQQEEDAKMGKTLLDARVKKRKVKNVQEYGKDHPNFLKYKQANPNDISSNAISVEYDDDKVVVTEEVEVSESGAPLDADGTPTDCIEIGVTSINLKTNAVNTGKIYSKSVRPDENM